MKRIEEISKAARKSADNHTENVRDWAEHRIGFFAGAQWADRTMIEKACEWLEQHANDYADVLHENEDESYAFVCVEELISDLKKTMEL